MQDHADDCAVVDTGICTCTRGIGQPAAQVTRKRLIDEYQRGKEEGYIRGFAEGEEAAWAKMIALQNRGSSVGFQDPDAEPFTQPVTIIPPMPVERPQMPTTGQTPIQHTHRRREHRHRAAPEAPATEYVDMAGYKRDEFDDVPEDDSKSLNWKDVLYLLGLSLAILLIVGSATWFFNVPRWPLITIGVAVTAFFIMLIKLDYDYRERKRRVR